MLGGLNMRFMIITGKHIITACSTIMVAVLVTVCSLSVFANSSKKLPIYCVETEKKQVAISFDAAWGADDTDTLIDILKQYNVKATFFTVATWVDKYQEEVKRLSDAGHSIQNHSSSHPHMTKISKQQMIDELKSCNEKIAKTTGKTPTLFRCPYGDYNNAVIDAVESIDMYTIQWDVDSRDWQETATVETITKYVVNNVKNGSIVLFHNDAKHTPEALPIILKSLKDQGYEFVLIEDLIYKENYEIKHDGTQCIINDGAN